MNSTEIGEDYQQPYVTGLAINLLWMVVFLLAFFAFTANFLLVLVLIIRANLRKQPHIVLVLTLSVADIVVATGVITHSMLLKFDTKSVYLCGVWLVLFSQGIFMSVYFTFIVSLNRFVSAVSTTWVIKLFGGKRKYALVSVPSAVIAVVNIIFTSHFERDISTCLIMRGANAITYERYMTMLNIPIFICTLTLYALTLRAIHVRFGRVMPQAPVATLAVQGTGPTATEVRRRRHLTAMKTLGIILALLTTGTIPFLFVFLLKSLQIAVMPMVQPIVGLGMLLNSALNPAVSTCRIKEVRTAVHNMYCRCCT